MMISLITKLRFSLQAEEAAERGKRRYMSKLQYEDIRKSEEVNAYLAQGNEMLGVLGYTDHSAKHAQIVADTAGKILKELDAPRRQIELAQIAGYMHDIGNCVNRTDHAHSGAILARSILKDMDMEVREIATVMNAIGSHDEKTGCATDPISAALILADKTDVRRNRVRNKSKASFDKHDRVNYAVTASKLRILPEKKTILFEICLDESICALIDYFEIFMQRMMMCRLAAEVLGMKFKMTANGKKVC